MRSDLLCAVGRPLSQAVLLVGLGNPIEQPAQAGSILGRAARALVVTADQCIEGRPSDECRAVFKGQRSQDPGCLVGGQLRGVDGDVRVAGLDVGIVNAGDTLDFFCPCFGVEPFAVPLLANLQAR